MCVCGCLRAVWATTRRTLQQGLQAVRGTQAWRAGAGARSVLGAQLPPWPRYRGTAPHGLCQTVPRLVILTEDTHPEGLASARQPSPCTDQATRSDTPVAQGARGASNAMKHKLWPGPAHTHTHTHRYTHAHTHTHAQTPPRKQDAPRTPTCTLQWRFTAGSCRCPNHRRPACRVKTQHGGML